MFAQHMAVQAAARFVRVVTERAVKFDVRLYLVLGAYLMFQQEPA